MTARTVFFKYFTALLPVSLLFWAVLATGQTEALPPVKTPTLSALPAMLRGIYRVSSKLEPIVFQLNVGRSVSAVCIELGALRELTEWAILENSRVLTESMIEFSKDRPEKLKEVKNLARYAFLSAEKTTSYCYSKVDRKALNQESNEHWHAPEDVSQLKAELDSLKNLLRLLERKVEDLNPTPEPSLK